MWGKWLSLRQQKLVYVVSHGFRNMFGQYPRSRDTANLPSNIVGFRGFDSSIILILRGEIPRPIGDFPASLSQAMLEGIMVVARLGVPPENETPDLGQGEGGYIYIYIYIRIHIYIYIYIYICKRTYPLPFGALGFGLFRV